MNQNEYQNRMNSYGRKQNGNFTREALSRMGDDLRKAVVNLKLRYHTSPKTYGMGLANTPRHAHAKGRRVLHTTNF